MNVGDWVGLYGAVLSTVLAAREVWAAWRKRVVVTLEVKDNPN